MSDIEIPAQSLINIFSMAASVTQPTDFQVTYTSVTQSTKLSHREQRQKDYNWIKICKAKLTKHLLQNLTVNHFLGQFIFYW